MKPTNHSGSRAEDRRADSATKYPDLLLTTPGTPEVIAKGLERDTYHLGMSAFQTHPAAGERTGWWERGPFAVDQPIWWMLGHPFEHMIAIARLIYSGLLDRYPNLKFIFEEGNVGYALYLFDRLEAGWEFGEMIYGSRVHLRGPKKRPLAYLEHFHWAVESEDSLIAEVVKRWGAERVLFSTDYPHGDTPWPESVKEMKEALAPYSAAEQAKVLGGNAARLLHL